MFKRLKNKLKNKLNNYFNNLLDPKLKEIKESVNSLSYETKQNIDNKKEETIDDVRRLIKASIVNRETFEPYKDYCKGKKLVICGAGPSLNKYKPIPGAIHIALNRAFLFDKVHFDFIFCMDFNGIIHYKNELKKYPNCVKMLGDYSNSMNHLPQVIEELLLDHDVKRWILQKAKDINDSSKMYFERNIDTTNLCDFPQVGLVVLQFACFMNPCDIYLVGYDQSGGHFTAKNLNFNQSIEDKQKCDNWFNWTNKTQQKCWEKFIEFKNYHYPNIKIHSINPVGLKDMFDDIYQEIM